MQHDDHQNVSNSFIILQVITQQNSKMEIIANFNVDTDQGVEDLIRFTRSLSPEVRENFKVIKVLIESYGLPIMIYLESFYSAITPSLAKENKMQLQSIAGMAAEMMAHREIREISFLFRYEKRQQKKIPLTEEAVMFLSFISELSQINSSLKNSDNQSPIKMGASQYQEIISSNKKSEYLTRLMKRSIDDFRISKERLSELVNKSPNIAVSKEDSQFSSENEEQQSFNFYTHQSGALSKKNYGTTSDISLDSSIRSDFSQKNSHASELNKYLCCRSYFYENQVIRAEQNVRTSFTVAHYPFSEASIQAIKRIICSFLNCQGGKLYIGVQKQKHGLQQMVGDIYTESQRQEIQKCFRMMAQGIEPEILTQKMYSIDFVPIREQSGIFIPGACIIRVSVNYGIRDEVYSYQSNDFDCFPFRNGFEVIEKQGRSLLKSYRSIIKNPLPIPEPLHSEPCLRPDVGELLHSKQTEIRELRKNNQRFLEGETDGWRMRNMNQSNVLNISDPLLLRQQAKAEKASHSHSLTMHEKPSNQVGISKVSTNDSISHSRFHSHKIKNVYFYVVGLDTSQLTPLLAQRKLLDNVKLESSKEKQLVAKVHGQEEIAKVKKMLLKIESKYKERNVKVYEMSLELEVDRRCFGEAIERVTSLGISHKIYDNNHIKFKLFRDSFQAFIELDSLKIPVRFIHRQETPITCIG